MCDCNELSETPPEKGGHILPRMANPTRRRTSVESIQVEIADFTKLECPIRKEILALLEKVCPDCGYNFAQKR